MIKSIINFDSLLKKNGLNDPTKFRIQTIHYIFINTFYYKEHYWLDLFINAGFDKLKRRYIALDLNNAGESVILELIGTMKRLEARKRAYEAIFERKDYSNYFRKR
jgi:hypothetical protein